MTITTKRNKNGSYTVRANQGEFTAIRTHKEKRLAFSCAVRSCYEYVVIGKENEAIH